MVRKCIISVFFLLIHSIGFAHEIIPHHHDGNAPHLGHTTEGHHKHEHNHIDNDHHHVSHQDHFDNDIFDLLLCVLNETKHSSENESTNCCIISQSISKNSKSFGKYNSFLLHIDQLYLTHCRVNIKHYSFTHKKHSLLHLSTSLHRGPPYFI